MAEYIEREALKNNLHFTTEGIFYHNGKAYMDLNIVDKIVLETPTADVVEVVRCKDCGKSRETESERYLFCMQFADIVNCQAFCSYGTPKERGGEK